VSKTNNETGETVTINGTAFTVTKRESAVEPYLLTKVGGRGLAYTAMRNAKRPHLLFLVNANQRGSSAVTNVWITDEGGTIRQAQ